MLGQDQPPPSLECSTYVLEERCPKHAYITLECEVETGLFELGGWLSEGVEKLELVVQHMRGLAGPERNRILGRALGQEGLLLIRWGIFDRALTAFEESIDLLRPLGDLPSLTHSLVYSSVILHLNGDIDQAQIRVQEAYAGALAAHDDWFLAYALLNQGYIASLLGRYDEGYRQMREGIAMWRKLGDPQAIALGLNYLSPTAVHLRRFAEAEANMRESLDLCARSGHRWGMGTAYRFWALAALAQGKLDQAESLIDKSLAVFREIVTGYDIVLCNIYLGEIKAAQNDTDEAKRLFKESARMANELGVLTLVMDALIGLAGVHAQLGEIPRALELALCVREHSASTEVAKSRAEQLLAALSPRIRPQQLKAAQVRIRAKGLEETLEGVYAS